LDDRSSCGSRSSTATGETATPRPWSTTPAWCAMGPNSRLTPTCSWSGTTTQVECPV